MTTSGGRVSCADDVPPVTAWEKSVRPGEAKALADDIIERARDAGADVLVVDGDLVFGTDHLSSALYHAAKSLAEGRSSSDSLTMETLLYAAGERQLGSAIRKMSAGDRTTSVVVAVLRGGLPLAEGWAEIPRTRGGDDRRRLARFGVSEEELGTVSEGQAVELVLERVASVDVVRR